MKEIITTNNGIVLVDNEDYEWLNQFKWYKTTFRYTFAAVCYIKPNTTWMHRLIMKTPKYLVTDHKDHNGLNNQKSNLRVCTQSQNHMNTPCRNGYKGVSWQKSRQKYISTIYRNGKSYMLGRYKIEEEAAEAYNIAAIKMFGEYACLNKVGKWA